MGESPKNGDSEVPKIKIFSELKSEFEEKRQKEQIKEKLEEVKNQEGYCGDLGKDSIEEIAKDMSLNITLQEEKVFGKIIYKATFDGTDRQRDEFFERVRKNK